MTASSFLNPLSDLDRTWRALERGSDHLADGWSAVLSHLWLSTWFIALLALASLLLRKAPPELRNRIWSLALLKLLLPVSLLGGVGERWLFPANDTGWVRAPLDGLTRLIPIDLVTRVSDSSSAGAVTFIWLITVVWAWTASRILVKVHQRSRFVELQPPDLTPSQESRLAALRSGLGLAPGRVVVTGIDVIPCVIGIFRPRIVLSRQTLDRFPNETLLAIGLHELAHVRRYEPLRMLLERIAMALFFFYPPLWFLLDRLHKTRELTCDDAAVAAGANPRELACAISLTVHVKLGALSPGAALGSSRPSLLAERVKRLRTHRRHSPMHRHHGTVALATLALFGLVFAPSPGRLDARTSPGEGNHAAGPGASVQEEPRAFDVSPKPIAESMVLPAYPEDYRKANASGRVLLEVHISAEGVISEMKEKAGVEGFPEFTKSAETAVARWKFEPATLDGHAVPAVVVIPIQFALD